MRGILQSALLLTTTLLIRPSDGTPAETVASEEVESDAAAKGIVFNDQDVPPFIDLEGPTWNDTVSTGYWLVEAFSPYCHHCQSLAPKWQTLYEYYYTSDPAPSSSEPNVPTQPPNSFTDYYNMKFAKLDCVAFGSACVEMKVQSFPTIVLFKDGEEVKRSDGDKDMKKLSAFIEECLELIRPGSRPSEGIELPKVGAREFRPKEKPAAVVKAEKQKDLSSTPDKTTKKASKPPRVSNPSGTSVAFTAELFQNQVTRSLDPWFIKFYAPWCPHCQKIAPSWSQMARQLKGRLDVGEVNCDTHKRLCREMDIASYPTIVYFRGPEHVEYEGMRGLGDLIRFAEDAVEVNRGVQHVNADQLVALEEKEEVIFVYFYDHATTSEDLLALERLPLSLIGRAKLVKTDDREIARRFNIFSWPRLLVIRGGKPILYDWLMPQDMRNVNKIRRWMQTVWHPLVPELTASNARDIMDNKYVVLGILDRHREADLIIAKREIKNAAIEWMDRQEQQFAIERQELRDAKQLRVEEAEDRNDQRALRNAKLIRINMNEIEHKEVAFAWIDGVFWQRWIKTTFGVNIKDGDRVIINDHINQRYWDRTSTGNHIIPSRTSILETLTQIYAQPPKLAAKPTGSSVARAFFKTKHMLGAHPWLFSIGGVITLTIATICYCKTRRRRRIFGAGGFLKLESEKEKGTANGPNGPNGKAD